MVCMQTPLASTLQRSSLGNAGGVHNYLSSISVKALVVEGKVYILPTSPCTKLLQDALKYRTSAYARVRILESACARLLITLTGRL